MDIAIYKYEGHVEDTKHTKTHIHSLNTLEFAKLQNKINLILYKITHRTTINNDN